MAYRGANLPSEMAYHGQRQAKAKPAAQLGDSEARVMSLGGSGVGNHPKQADF